MGVAIVGIGMHPFGRFEGMAGLDLGAFRRPPGAARHGHPVDRRPVHVRREPPGMLPGAEDRSRPSRSSRSSDSPASNSPTCTTGARPRAAPSRWRRRSSGRAQHDLGVAVGYESKTRGHFNADPAAVGPAALVRRPRLHGHDAVLRDEAQPVHARLRDQPPDAPHRPRLAAKKLPQRRAQPERVATQAVQRGGDPRGEDAQLPADSVHVLLARRGRGRGRAVPRRRTRTATPSGRSTCARSRCIHAGGVRSRCSRRGSRSTAATPPTVDTAKACFEQAGVSPPRRRRRAAAGQRVRRGDHAHVRDRALRRRRAGGDDRRGQDRDRRPAPRQHRRRADRQRRADGPSGMRQVHEIVLQLRGDAGERQVPGNPSVGFTQVYGAPGVSACTLLTT